MRIKYMTGPRAGQIDHAPNSQETYLLIKAGILEELPYKDFRERLREEGQGMQTPDPHFVQGVQFSVAERLTPAVGQGRAYIVRRSGQEVLYGESPDAFKDCPQSIRVQFLKVNHVEDPEVVAERQVQENFRRQAEQKAQRERENAGMYRVTGGQKL